MIRSGLSSVIAGIDSPSADSSTVGLASPSLSTAQGKTAYGASPTHWVVAIGTTPRASSVSCSVYPTTTMRFGSALTVVVPYMCWTVTGNVGVGLADGAGAGSSPLQADRPPSRAAESEPARKSRRLSGVGTGLVTTPRVARTPSSRAGRARAP